jgi:hypothetical protein
MYNVRAVYEGAEGRRIMRGVGAGGSVVYQPNAHVHYLKTSGFLTLKSQLNQNTIKSKLIIRRNNH